VKWIEISASKENPKPRQHSSKVGYPFILVIYKEKKETLVGEAGR
jgi:hypothetical protein